MTREEADFIGGMNMCDEISNEAYRKIMCHCEEQEPCEDAISRQAVIDAFHSKFADGFDIDRWWNSTSVLYAINEVPSVNPQKTGWIPVSERLPEDNELVLFSTKTDRVFEGRFFSDNTDRQWYSFRDETFAWNNVVIAWMPLPEPYKAESEE